MHKIFWPVIFETLLILSQASTRQKPLVQYVDANVKNTGTNYLLEVLANLRNTEMEVQIFKCEKSNKKYGFIN